MEVVAENTSTLANRDKTTVSWLASQSLARRYGLTSPMSSEQMATRTVTPITSSALSQVEAVLRFLIMGLE